MQSNNNQPRRVPFDLPLTRAEAVLLLKQQLLQHALSVLETEQIINNTNTQTLIDDYITQHGALPIIPHTHPREPAHNASELTVQLARAQYGLSLVSRMAQQKLYYLMYGLCLPFVLCLICGIVGYVMDNTVLKTVATIGLVLSTVTYVLFQCFGNPCVEGCGKGDIALFID